jgi:C-terminal processing protease CtpA/Prc
LQAGDVIVEIDGIKANKDNIAELLRGEDVPESSVDLLIRRKEELSSGWQLVPVTFARSRASELADSSRLLQLLSRMKKSADRISEVHAC